MRAVGKLGFNLREERVEQLEREPDQVVHELECRLRAVLHQAGGLNRVYPLPASGQDVPDDLDARLVVLGTDHPDEQDGAESAGAGGRRAFSTDDVLAGM